MTTEEKNYWFPAKRYGWGWGMPIAWQGWVVMGAFFCLLIAGGVALLPRYGPPTYLAYTILLCALLVAVCWVKGERPRWRWGKK